MNVNPKSTVENGAAFKKTIAYNMMGGRSLSLFGFMIRKLDDITISKLFEARMRLTLKIIKKSKIAYVPKSKIPFGLLNQKEDATAIYILFLKDFYAYVPGGFSAKFRI